MDITIAHFGTVLLPRKTPPKALTHTIAAAVSIVSILPLTANASDETVLTNLYDSITANRDALTGWGSGNFCSGWKGVVCNTAKDKVITLNLANLDLAGQLPDDITELSELTELDLSNNAFTGSIPSDIGDLSKLETLKLDRNALEGAAPVSMKNLTALTKLNLDYNMLESSGNEETDTFLAEKEGRDWQATQTIAPTGLKVTQTTIDSISLSWEPISYTADGGKYEIIVSPDADLSPDDDTIYESDDKTSSTLKIAGLLPSMEYHFAIRTRTEEIPGKPSDWKLISAFSKSVSAFTLLDTDGDGTPDAEDTDADGDGISNEAETLTKDSDADGLEDYLEPNNLDTDGDGKPDYLDPDDDNDGKVTSTELGPNPDYPADSDNDGIRDYLDADSKNEANTSDGSGDSDKDGLSDKEECPNPHHCANTDGKAPANYMDQDDDDDGLPTTNEGPTLDSDSDGVKDFLEPNNRDTDGDGKRDNMDDDDDGDGSPTRDELGGDPLDPRDKDGDGIPDYLDADSDNSAKTEDGSGDSDGDGISDMKECPTAPACPDANGNGLPAYMDVEEKTEIIRIRKGGAFGLPLLGSLFAMAFGLRRRGKRH